MGIDFYQFIIAKLYITHIKLQNQYEPCKVKQSMQPSCSQNVFRFSEQFVPTDYKLEAKIGTKESKIETQSRLHILKIAFDFCKVEFTTTAAIATTSTTYILWLLQPPHHFGQGQLFYHAFFGTGPYCVFWFTCSPFLWQNYESSRPQNTKCKFQFKPFGHSQDTVHSLKD